MRQHNHTPSLIELAEHLDTGELLHEVFDYSEVNTGLPATKTDIPYCGTVGCAAAELAALTDRVGFANLNDPNCIHWLTLDGKGSTIGKISKTFWGLEIDEYSHLFFPLNQCPGLFGGNRLEENATRYEVANNIREFVKRFPGRWDTKTESAP